MSEIKKRYDQLFEKTYKERLKKYGSLNKIFENRINTPWHQMATEFLSTLNMKNKLVLEVGSGWGVLSVRMAQMGAKVIGIDISSKIIKISRKFAELFKVSVSFENMIAEKIGFRSNIFDLVVSCATLEHIPDYHEAIKEIIRVTKPGGKIIITIPNALNPEVRRSQSHSIQPVENLFTYFSILRDFKNVKFLRGKGILEHKLPKRIREISSHFWSFQPLRMFAPHVAFLFQKQVKRNHP